MVADRLRFGLAALFRSMRRYPVTTGIVVAIWALAACRVLVWHGPLLPVMFNWSSSLPFHVVVVDGIGPPYRRGDYVVFSFHGEASVSMHPGLSGQPFFKRIGGVAGDAVTVVGREVFVNGVSMGTAKDRTFDRRPLQPIEPVTIPPGMVYVVGSDPHSFDSRYSASGLVTVRDIIARVRPLL
jgi:conjugal transfer pilin signal peptidase TrbI